LVLVVDQAAWNDYLSLCLSKGTTAAHTFVSTPAMLFSKTMI